MGRHSVEVDPPVIDVESAIGEERRHVRLRFVLAVGAADAGPLHDIGDGGDEELLELVDRVQHSGAGLLDGHGSSP